MNNEKLLKEYNCWRRGESGYEMPDPTAIGIAIDSVIAQLAALKEENERLKARVAELEAVEPITAVLAYRNKGYRGVCGATVGADGQGFYAVVYRGLPFDSASNHARNLMRELEASKYQIGECLFVDASETISGNPISVVTKEPANEG